MANDWAPEPVAKAGRPSAFTQELADAICAEISAGKSLRAVCERTDFPSDRTVYRWLAADEAFCQQYARARESQADALFDEILEIADDGSNDWMERKDAEDKNIGWRENGEAMRRSQLRVDARKWMASKLLPKKYGDKLDLNHSGSIATMSEDQVNARLAELLRKAGVSGADGAQGPSDNGE